MDILGVSNTCKLSIPNHLLPRLYPGGGNGRSHLGRNWCRRLRPRPVCDRHHLLRYQSGEAFVQWHSQCADAARMQTRRRGKNQVRAVQLHAIAFVKVRSGYRHKNLIPFSPMTVNTDSM